jgi:hypothetical protein
VWSIKNFQKESVPEVRNVLYDTHSNSLI